MDKSQILEKLAAVVIDGTEDEAKAACPDCGGEQNRPPGSHRDGLVERNDRSSVENSSAGRPICPELLMAAASFNAAMAVLKPEIEAQKKQMVKLGKVLIGTVKGDVHSIGKDIVASVLDTSGFEVVDMGVDNPSLNIIQEAEKIQADVIALSSLMTTTMPGQKEVIDTLKEMGIREKYFVIVGGGPVNQEWADRIGADADTAGPPSMPWRWPRA